MSIRRRTVLLASALTLLTMGLIVLGVVLSVTQTEFGRERVRAYVAAQLRGKVRGKLHLGNLGGNFLTSLSLDSLEIRDADDSLFVASGPITIEYDPRDLIDKRVLLSHVRAERLVVRIWQDEEGEWSFRRVFERGRRRVAPTPERGFGDFVMLDSATLAGASFVLTMPWRPADTLRGARRDSAVAANLARDDREIRRVGNTDRFAETWRWTNLDAALASARIAHPDTAGRRFDVAWLRGVESYPPMRFQRAHGSVRILGDSLWLDVPRFELPGSYGSASGKVVWGSDLPVRYAIRVVGDSVSLEDVAWVYPTLPTTGGGSMVLDIRNDPRNLRVIEYAISEMDVRSTQSRLRGAMTYGVGGPVLVVKDVDVEAAPLDFALIERLNGKPFPYPWRGTLTGTIRAPGGPLDRFRVADARVTFRDANVPGAWARGTARGELDILFPAFTVFRGLDVNVERLDLRTLQFLNPNFPRINGTVAGTARLDSSWLDVRFSRADLAHRDGDGEPSRAVGSGRVTWGEQFLTWDLDLRAEALSFTTLARSFPALPVRGTYAGPVRVRGTIEDLELQTRLTGPAGTLGVAGRFDLYAPVFAARATGDVAALDLRTLLGRSDAPATSLTASYEAELTGDSLADLRGRASAEVARSEVDGVRLYPSTVRLRFADGRLTVDTLRLESTVATMGASGTLGLVAGVDGELSYRVMVDSLGGLRRWLLPARITGPHLAMADTGGLAGIFALSPRLADSLSGSLVLAGVVNGSIAAPKVRGTLEGRELFVRGDESRLVAGTFDISDLRAGPHGTVSVRLDSVAVGGIRLAEARADIAYATADSGSFHALLRSANGPTAEFGGRIRSWRDSAAVALDSATLAVNDGVYRLEAPARLTIDPIGLRLGRIALVHGERGRVSAGGIVPRTGPVDFGVRLDSVSLADLGILAQAEAVLAGRVQGEWRVNGTRAEPRMSGGFGVSDFRAGESRLERVALRGRYADRSLTTELDLFQSGARVIAGTLQLPVDLALEPRSRRMLDAPLVGRFRTDSVSLALLETLTPEVQRARGSLTADVAVGGTWARPVLTGNVRVADGTLAINRAGLRLQRVTGDVQFTDNRIEIRRLSAQSGDERGDTLAVTGVFDWSRWGDPTFRLQLEARGFHAIDRQKVAVLDVSTLRGRPLVLEGNTERARLSGAISVDRGVVYIPELAQKQVIDLNDPLIQDEIKLDRDRTLVNELPMFLRNLSADVDVALGRDVWLRSSEADIQLGGQLSVVRTQDRDDRPQLALAGELDAVRGTYRLVLGGVFVQPTFQVERGKLLFTGDPDLNPTLDISAIHTVRQPPQSGREDVRVRVTIGGTLAQPRLELSSADNPPLPPSDLISYLVTGQPAIALGAAGQQHVNTAVSMLLRTGGSALGSWISGGLADVVQIQSGGLDQTGQLNGQKAKSALTNTRVGVGWQVGDRTYVSATAGVCAFKDIDRQQSDVLQNLWHQLGARVEHRFNHGFSAEVGVEPSTQSANCASGAAASGTLIDTPRQVGFDLFRTWSF